MAEPLSQDETDALNKHGVFLKKRVLQVLMKTQGIGVVGEEIGFSFGGTRVLDILAQDNRAEPRVHLAFECKRVLSDDKHWIFFRDLDNRYRVARAQSSLLGHSSVFDRSEPPHPPVCSEGYEYTVSKKTMEQDPVFKAGAQLSAAFLGLIARRERDISKPTQGHDVYERYVPVLVTNAKLWVVYSDFSGVSLTTGNSPSPPNAALHDYVILKHPFPTPDGVQNDFRDSPAAAPLPEHWSQLHKESIYVVNAEALRGYLSLGHRDFLRAAVDSENGEAVVQMSL